MADGNGFPCFLCFQRSSSFSLEIVSYYAPLGSTVALNAYQITPSAITGKRGAAGGRQPATAKPSLYICVIVQ